MGHFVFVGLRNCGFELSAVGSSVADMSIAAPPSVGHPVMTALATLRGAIDETADPDAALWKLGDAELLTATAEYLQALAAVQALGWRLIGECERRRACWYECGVDTATWLRGTNHFSLRSARREVAVASAMTARFTGTGGALAAGRVSGEQAAAIVRVLDDLPADLQVDQVEAAEQTLLGFAREFDPQGLTRLAKATLDVVAPEVAERADAERLAWQEREAERTKYLRWSPDGHGSLLVWAKMPMVAGEALREVVEAIAAGAPVTGDDGDRIPLEVRRANALVGVVDAYVSSGAAPEKGGDRPRVTVLLDLETLRRGLSDAVLVGPDERLTAGDARRLACDADLLPMVLGGPSQVLDVGRTRRLFTDDLRQALVVRDRGCVFPGCEKPPRSCEAHHLIPWWSGGRTSLDNGALLCPPHHRLVEPDPHVPDHRQWHLRMSQEGVLEALPPAHVDAERRPRRHQRFRR